MTNDTCSRRRLAGSSLVELQISVVIGVILMLGLYVSIVYGTAKCTRDCLQGDSLADSATAAFNAVAYRLRQGVDTGMRTFAIYTSRTNMAAVADGAAGQCIFVPYNSSTDDIYVYALNGGFIIEHVTTGTQETILSSGVSSATFTADMSGSPLARTGAVQCSLSVTSQGTTVPLSTTIFPRNR